MRFSPRFQSQSCASFSRSSRCSRTGSRRTSLTAASRMRSRAESSRRRPRWSAEMSGGGRAALADYRGRSSYSTSGHRGASPAARSRRCLVAAQADGGQRQDGAGRRRPRRDRRYRGGLHREYGLNYDAQGQGRRRARELRRRRLPGDLRDRPRRAHHGGAAPAGRRGLHEGRGGAAPGGRLEPRDGNSLGAARAAHARAGGARAGLPADDARRNRGRGRSARSAGRRSRSPPRPRRRSASASTSRG